MQDGGTEPDEALDLVGVGFGPSNLGLAIAVAERAGPALTARFVERQERFGWHRGMLIDGTVMQVSFLKDLVTLRNPASEYSFLSYLHERGRLVDFINYGSPFPTRIEFHDYLEWAAAGFSDLVDYGWEVERITAVPGEPDLLDVHGPGGGVEEYVATLRHAFRGGVAVDPAGEDRQRLTGQDERRGAVVVLEHLEPGGGGPGFGALGERQAGRGRARQPAMPGAVPRLPTPRASSRARRGVPRTPCVAPAARMTDRAVPARAPLGSGAAKPVQAPHRRRPAGAGTRCRRTRC
jgi:hypothetical protein